MKNLCFLFGCCFSFAIFVPGCGSGESPDAAMARANKTNLQRLANLYSMYHAEHFFEGPENETAFREFIAGANAEKLANMGVDPSDLDQLFTSDRDGMPFKIRYGVQGSTRGSNEAVIFEQVGSGGKRRVGFTSMNVKEVNEEEYDQLWKGEKSAESNSGSRNKFER
jgi:hypothetical protein